MFRKPIIVKNVPPMVRSWEKPITIGRHAYGDVYKSAELKLPGAGRVSCISPKEPGCWRGSRWLTRSARSRRQAA